MEIRRISTADAVFEIFDADDRFTHLQQCILAQKEVKYNSKHDEWTIQLVNGRDFSDNAYTNPYEMDQHFWIAGYTGDDELVMLQLISVEAKGVVELVNCEKHTDEKNVFGQIVEWVERNYPGQLIATFPMTSELERYYISKGFEHGSGEFSKVLVKKHTVIVLE